MSTLLQVAGELHFRVRRAEELREQLKMVASERGGNLTRALDQTTREIEQLRVQLEVVKQEVSFEERNHAEVMRGVTTQAGRIAASWFKVARGFYKISKFRLPSPETAGRVMGFFLPRVIRERYYEPFFEDLKIDRIEKQKLAKSKFTKGAIETLIYLRLVVTYLESLLCWLRDILLKLMPVLKWFIGK